MELDRAPADYTETIRIDPKFAHPYIFKVVINNEGYLAESLTAIALLAILATASAGIGSSTKHLFFKDLPRRRTWEKMEVYFSQGVIFEELDNTLNIQVKIPIISIDGYRVL